MKICKEHSNESMVIVYEGDQCPACCIEENVTQLKRQIDELENDLNYYRDLVKPLKEEIKKLKEAKNENNASA